MSSGIFGIGTSALNAAYTALRTASNNIANINTPGYTRQITVLAPQTSTSISGLYLGQGVAVADVRRVYSDFLAQQAHQAQSQGSAATIRWQQLAQVSNLFGDPAAGIGAAIDGFFRAVQDLTQRPADPAARQALLSAAGVMATRFNDVGDRLQEMRFGSDRQLQLEIDAVNGEAQRIAEMNNRIALAKGAGVPANDLLDLRDASIRRLSESVRVSAIEQSDGSVNLYLSGGQSLVVGATANQLARTAGSLDPQAIRVGIRNGAGVLALDPSAVGGGRIGGLLQFREIDLPAIENQLGRVAASIGEVLNAQHRLGDDRTGAPGGDLFVPVAANAFAVSSNGNAATSISATITDAKQLVASDYRIDFIGGLYTLTRASDGASWTQAGTTFNQDGLEITLTATPPADGDRFIVQALRNASRNFGVAIDEIARIAAAAPLRTTVPATNTGAVRVDDISVLSPRIAEATLKRAATLTFTSPTEYSLSDGVSTVTGTYTQGVPIDFNGWRLTLTGEPATGDRIDISANVGGIGDNRNALKLAQLAGAPLADGTTLANGFATVIADLGGATRGAELHAVAQNSILDSALSAESSVSGVNLDEEASRLIQYQQQYQAAAKIIAAARVVFDEILSIGK